MAHSRAIYESITQRFFSQNNFNPHYITPKNIHKSKKRKWIFPIIGDGISRELSAYLYHYRLILHVPYTQTPDHLAESIGHETVYTLYSSHLILFHVWLSGSFTQAFSHYYQCPAFNHFKSPAPCLLEFQSGWLHLRPKVALLCLFPSLKRMVYSFLYKVHWFSCMRVLYLLELEL